MAYSKATLQKIEDFFKVNGYTIRYEKGHFQSGYCVVKTKDMVIINKFYDTKQRAITLISVLNKILETSTFIANDEDVLFFKKFNIALTTSSPQIVLGLRA